MAAASATPAWEAILAASQTIFPHPAGTNGGSATIVGVYTNANVGPNAPAEIPSIPAQARTGAVADPKRRQRADECHPR